MHMPGRSLILIIDATVQDSCASLIFGTKTQTLDKRVRVKETVVVFGGSPPPFGQFFQKNLDRRPRPRPPPKPHPLFLRISVFLEKVEMRTHLERTRAAIFFLRQPNNLIVSSQINCLQDKNQKPR